MSMSVTMTCLQPVPEPEFRPEPSTGRKWPDKDGGVAQREDKT
jgi:hypothetical protein